MNEFITEAITPTAEQLAIQRYPERSLLIEAAAGAAKTTTLALRICQALALGADPRGLLALTFTDTACTALRQALRFIGCDPQALKLLRIETFDSFAAGVLREAETLDGEDPVEHFRHAEQAAPFVWAAIEQVGANPREPWPDELQLPSHGSDSYVGEFLRRTAGVKGRLLLELNPAEGGRDTPDHAVEDLGLDYTLLRVLRRYEAHRIESGRGHANFRMPLDATYDLARLLLPAEDEGEDRIDPQSLPLGRWRGVFVDELHDCNAAMFTILQALLANPAVHFCAVGDRHQVIHQMNGADARFMSRELDAGLGRRLKRLPLSLSFRYGPPLARWMGRHAGKTIAGDAKAETRLAGIACDAAGLASTEEAVVATLKAWRSEQRKDKVYEDCAVLLRHPSQSMLIENALHRERIAYRCDGFTTYLLRPEVLFVRCAFAVASERLDTLGGARTRALIPAALFEMTQTPVLRDGDPDYRSAETFLREASKQAADSEVVVAAIFNEHIMNWAPKPVQQRLRRAMAVARGSSSGDCAFEDFLAALDMPRFAMDAYVDRERRQEVQRHMAGLASASHSHAGALAFFGFLRQLDEEDEQRLAGLAAGRTRSNRIHVPAITLASASHVKGLEFEHVLLPYLKQGVFPDAGADAADERNLFYVAATRARSRLTVMVDASRPSEFVPPELVQRVAA
ncbi:3'-5' exonuclease [Paucibacter sp. R3-3]|uniref:DNA 3'-5' helicase n=1 Tax=Roseateles agri TaxID=3098619 RepID=A0ABU5DGG5_9BURK|nr:UvrD-helicase domain-containing protein [Paucibacter sp. R3-3]MDY0744828.1 3'-5' exonuclease [Paucibacter sp. R3-3]